MVACGGSSGGGEGGSAGEGGQGGGAGGSAGEGGAGGSDVACLDSVCPCTEPGIRAAIAEGGGPFTFDCNGATTVVTDAEIVLDNDVILDGEGNLTVDGNEAHRVFSVPETVTAELTGFTITKGLVLGDLGFGGGIQNEGTLTLTDSTVSGNIATVGGGIFNLGTLTVTTTAVSGNNTMRSEASGATGGGIFNRGTLAVTNSRLRGNRAVFGGGIYNYNPGMLTLTDSSVRENTAFYGGGIQNGGTLALVNSTVYENSGSYGGGIHNGSIDALTLTNSTVSGNTAVFTGGGIHNEGTLTLTNSTVSRNTAVDTGSGIENYRTLTVTNSLVDGECGTFLDPSITVTSNGYNIESPGDTCGLDHGSDLVNVPDPMLGPLRDNGGPTRTHALLPGSVAIDHIPAVDCQVTEDQRGLPRPGGSMCDVGAFEVQPEP